MQGVRAGEIDVVQEVDGIIQIHLAAAVKVAGLIHGVSVSEIHVVQQINRIVQIYLSIFIHVTGDVKRISFKASLVANCIVVVIVYVIGNLTNVVADAAIRVAGIFIFVRSKAVRIGSAANRARVPMHVGILI